MLTHHTENTANPPQSDPAGAPLVQRLHHSEALNRTLLDLNPSPMAIYRIEDSCLVLANRSWCEMTGYTPEEVIGRTSRDLETDIDPANCARAIETIQQQGGLESIDVRIKTKAGRFIDARMSPEMIFYQGEKCILCNTTHINKLSLDQAVLRESERRFQNILENLSATYYEVDLTGRVSFINDTFMARTFSRTKEELLGMNFKQYTIPEDIPKVSEAYQDVYKGNCAVNTVEYRIARTDGTLSYVEASANLLKDEMNHPIGFFGIIRDLTEQRKAEEAFQRSEEKNHRILQEMEEGYYEVDLKGSFTYFNPAIPKIYGYPAEELMGMNHTQYMTPEQAQKIYRRFNAMYKSGQPVKYFEYEVIHKSGAVCFVELSSYPLRNRDGDMVGFWGIVRDRTEQRKAEMALRHSEEKHRNILESMDEGYYEFDLKGAFTDFNMATCRMHGYSASELMGLSFEKYSSADQSKRVKKIYNQVYQTAQPARLTDITIIHKDGTPRYIETSAYIRKNEQGDPIGFWGISRDRTEKKQAEFALKESERQYRLLVENANDGIYITQQGRIEFHNPRTSEITGYSNEALAHMEFMDLVHPQDQDAVYAVQRRRLKEGQAPVITVFRIFNMNKEVLWVELNAVGITWQGQPATLNFLRDVTQLKKTESRLQQAHKMEAIGTLAGGIAHDFNNILYAMLGFTELALEDAPKGTQLEENLEDAISAGKRARDLVLQILAFARQSEEKVEPVIVSTIAKEALKLIRSSIPSTIEMQTHIKSDAWIMGNPTQVHQVIMNLCTNAAHAMETTGGVLEVHLTETSIDKKESDICFNLNPGTYLCLSISDTGCGIAPENLNAIFEPYFTTKSPGEGTGMGLSVVQGIVESYGGKITVQSELNKGATFTLLLPMISGQFESNPAESKSPAPSKGRILFVDDEMMITRMAVRTLERQSYDVTALNSSLPALELFRDRPDDFDLVITDMTMPKMTGDRLARELLRIRPDIPIVICTGYSKMINEEEAGKLGIKAFIYKPIEKNELIHTIRRVLERKKPIG